MITNSKYFTTMAKYSITYKCGHTCDTQLFGTYKSRERYIEWAKDNKFCPECAEAKVREHRRKENEASAQEAQECGYIELQGSPKQVAWANSIRAKAIAVIDEVKELFDAKVKRYHPSQDIIDKNYADLNNVMDVILAIEDSKVFIDRYRDFRVSEARWILSCKAAIKLDKILPEKEFSAKVLEYDTTLPVDRQNMTDPRYVWMSDRDVESCKKRFPEMFK